MAGLATLRPDHDDQTSVEMAGSDEPRLAVVEAIVDHRRRQSGEHLAGPGEIKPTMPEREIAFRRIERDRHS